MSDLEALTAAIRDNPDDDTPRLVLADWFDENSQPARGEFVRVQCELARLDPASDRYPELHVRQLQLLAEHERDWLGEWADRLVRWEFRRGMLEDVTIQPEPYCRHGEALFRDHPVGRVAFVDDSGESLEPSAVRDVIAQPHSRWLRAIDAAGCRPGEQASAMFGGQIHTNSWLEELARNAALDRLRELSLYGGTRSGRDDIDLAAWQEFCSAEHLHGLTHLDLSNHYDYHGDSHAWAPLIRDLAGAKFTSELRSLRFEGCYVGAEALGHLTRSRRFVRLQAVTVGSSLTEFSLSRMLPELLDAALPALRELTIPFADDMAEFADHPGWSRIERLGFVGVGDTRDREGGSYLGNWRAVCRSPHIRPTAFYLDHWGRDMAWEVFWDELAGAAWFPNLSELYLDVHDYSCAALFNRPLDGFPELRALQLSPDTELVERLAGWPGLANLTELGLNDSYGSTLPEATVKLFKSPHLSPRLARLRVSGLCRSAESVAALAGCAALVGLQHLDFAFNHLSEEGAVALANSPYLRHLKSLHTWSEWEQKWGEAHPPPWFKLADPAAFPQLRDVVIGSGSDERLLPELRHRLGPRLRIFSDC